MQCDTAVSRFFHVPANRIVLYLLTLQTKCWQQPTVWGHWATQCSSPPGLHIPKTYFWTKVPQLPAYSPPTMNSLLLGYIPYTGKLVSCGTAIAIHNTTQTQGEDMDYTSSYTYMTIPQQSKGSFTTFNACSSGHILLSRITYF